MIDPEYEQKLERELRHIHTQMLRLDARDDLAMARAYQNAEAAEERMVSYRNEHGEDALFTALRENPDQFGAYPDDKAQFDDAYQARKQLPVVFAEYRRLRDEADIIKTQLKRIRRERDEPAREDENLPRR
ncbi:hypothetical protein FE840_020715 (plasmid) [Peteryoungia desertarenae]|uniref:Uncharacterized protein n=1 Tax=Peteryoungia desertarenae TaxID=1813451 RepID=A0ABX6QUN5_9HYPH|nr:hypothetical protein [Peteryoungia desertarenae]QLF72061.1 hypothetical protein FE840_020715 [Peteryoungia desertarenae]